MRGGNRMEQSLKIMPIEIIEAAQKGEHLALAYILNEYKSYIKALSIKVLQDKNGCEYIFIDEDKQAKLMSQLIFSIMHNFKILP